MPIFRGRICEFQGVLFKKMSCFQNESLDLSGGTEKRRPIMYPVTASKSMAKNTFTLDKHMWEVDRCVFLIICA